MASFYGNFNLTKVLAVIGEPGDDLKGFKVNKWMEFDSLTVCLLNDCKI